MIARILKYINKDHQNDDLLYDRMHWEFENAFLEEVGFRKKTIHEPFMCKKDGNYAWIIGSIMGGTKQLTYGFYDTNEPKASMVPLPHLRDIRQAMNETKEDFMIRLRKIRNER